MDNKLNKTMKKGERAFFAFADFYGGGGQALIGVLYFFFLTNVIGLQPALAGIVTLISEIWDAISDPLMGVISDNTKTKMGRRRPFILLGGCLLAVAFGLIFLPVEGMSEAFCSRLERFHSHVVGCIGVSYRYYCFAVLYKVNSALNLGGNGNHLYVLAFFEK